MMRKGMAVKAMGHFGAERGTFFLGKMWLDSVKKETFIFYVKTRIFLCIRNGVYRTGMATKKWEMMSNQLLSICLFRLL